MDREKRPDGAMGAVVSRPVKIVPTPADARVAHAVNGQQESEEALRASEERLLLAMDAAQMGSWDWDMRSGDILWTPQHEKLLGYEPGQPHRTYEEFIVRVHPDDRRQIEDAIRECLARHTDYSHEFRVVWPDGSIHWISGFGRFYFDSQGRPIRMVGMVVDITARKEKDELVRRSGEFAASQWAEAEAALEALPASIAILDIGGVIVRVTRRGAPLRVQTASPPARSASARIISPCAMP